MPIEVHCPNPACAKVHQVKNKYAGTRGKCPLCQSWMYVPKVGLTSSIPSIELPPVVAPSPVPALDESPPYAREKSQPAARKAAPRTVVAETPAIEDEDEAPISGEPLRARRQANAAHNEDAPRKRAPQTVVAKSQPDEEDEEAPPSRSGAAKNDAARKRAPRTVVAPSQADEDDEDGVNEQPPPRRKPAARAAKEDIEEISDGDVLVEEEEAPAKPKRHFSWVAVLFLLLALLGVGAFVSARWLPESAWIDKSGAFENLSSPRPMTDDNLPMVLALAGAVGFLSLMTLLLALIMRRMGFATLLLLYLATFGSALMLMVSGEWLMREHKTYEDVQKRISDMRREGKQGEANLSFGLQYYALAGGAATAAFGLVFAGVFMHKRIWSKLLGFVVLSFLPTLAVTWQFRKELGIEGVELPPDLKLW